MMNKQKGFTLIELLVVIAIIGLLSTLAVVSLNSARQKSRDAKRVADVKQIQTALELYYQDQNSYPTAASAITLGAGGGDCSAADCSSLSGDGGFAAAATGETYMGLVPAAPTPADGTCTDAENGYEYTSADGKSYSIDFCLGAVTGGLVAGAHTASPDGIN
ncbi:type II secretion system protein [Candidatus Falkowbacteria bacterium]|nr:type II secretion system protein [Candidatus Falkowbacteria bacterium]